MCVKCSEPLLVWSRDLTQESVAVLGVSEEIQAILDNSSTGGVGCRLRKKMVVWGLLHPECN